MVQVEAGQDTRFNGDLLTSWSHILYKEAPVCIDHKRALELLFPRPIDRAKVLIQMMHDIRFMENDQLLANSILSKYWYNGL